MGFASWMHFLRFRKDARIWQDKSVDAILSDVFNMHPQARGAFRFDVRRPLPPRSFCMQYEDDWNFVHRLMESEGLFSCFEQADDGKSHTLVVVDDVYRLMPLSQQTVDFYRAGTDAEADALVQWSGTRTLQSTSLSTRTFDYKTPGSLTYPKGTNVSTVPNQGDLPAQAEVYEYTGAYTYGPQDRGEALSRIRMEEWESRAKRFYGTGGLRAADAGRWFELRNHPDHARDNEQQRQFAIVEAAWFIENNLPVSNHAADFPHSLAGVLAAARARQQGRTVSHADGSEGFFLVDIEAQRRAVPYRSPFEHHKPDMHMQTAIVAGPANEEVYTDSLNRIKVRFHWDRLNEGDENASCWVRVAMSDTGGGYGDVHVPRVGEEVLIDWVDGDCDRPLATGRVYNGATRPHWHSNGLLSGYKSKEYQGTGYNQMVMDDSTGQNRVQLYSSNTNALLHLGYLVDQSGNNRGAYLGSGFDLKSDAYGAVRAGQGLYVTTHPVAAQQLGAGDSVSQLLNSESVLESMSDASTTHQAESLKSGYEALKSFTDAAQRSVSGAVSGGKTAGGGTGNANAFKEPIMLLGSPAGIALSTQRSVHIAANAQANLVSGQNTHIATGKSLVASVAEKLSLFVQNAGMKLFAAKGKIEIRAHSDNIEVTAQKTVKVLSAAENIEAAAKQEILLTSGGAYIRVADGNIEIHAPGKVDVKGGQHSFAGPAARGYVLPALPHSGDGARYHEQFHLVDDDGETVLAHTRYEIESESGAKWTGYSDANGFTQHVFTDNPEALSLTVFREVDDDDETEEA